MCNRIGVLLAVSAVAAGCICGWATPSGAAMTVFNSGSPAGNDAALADWLGAIGITEAEVEHFEDFESGFAEGQNISGVGGLLGGNLTITDTGSGTPAAILRGSSSYFGGSNPIGRLAVAHDEQPYLVLDFALRPVDYVAIQDIDHSGTGVVVHFEGGTTDTASFETTATGGNSAEFFGIYRGDQPRITRIEFDASGDREWGIDNLRYGIVPEPATLGLVGLGSLGVLLRRRRNRPA